VPESQSARKQFAPHGKPASTIYFATLHFDSDSRHWNSQNFHSMLSGKVAVITGSCSGLGAEIARYLSSRGASVVINYPWESLKTAADEVAKTLAGPHITVEADLSTVDGPKHLIETAAAKFGRIDILVNNASYAIFKPMDEYTLEDFEGLVNTNCRGYFFVTQAVLPHLNPKNSRIINIVSSDSRFPSPNHSLYSGSKGMQDSFVRTWAKELPLKYGCTVNAVSPGPSA
jgi:NAD(P)-dependent dehydrogenase (short-subunit alcohol dehydrogenase family)